VAQKANTVKRFWRIIQFRTDLSAYYEEAVPEEGKTPRLDTRNSDTVKIQAASGII